MQFIQIGSKYTKTSIYSIYIIIILTVQAFPQNFKICPIIFIKTRPKSVRRCASLTWLIFLIWLFLMIWMIKLISHSCRFREILHQNYNISWLEISLDITPHPQYAMVADFVRFYTGSPISHGWRFCEILHQNYNISWLKISWDITPEPQVLIVSDFVRYYIRTRISHGQRYLRYYTRTPISHS